MPGSGEEEESVFNGDRFQFGEIKELWRWIEVMMPPNCMLKMVKMVNIVASILPQF